MKGLDQVRLSLTDAAEHTRWERDECTVYFLRVGLPSSEGWVFWKYVYFFWEYVYFLCMFHIREHVYFFQNLATKRTTQILFTIKTHVLVNCQFWKKIRLPVPKKIGLHRMSVGRDACPRNHKSGRAQLLIRNMKRFRGGLVFKARRLVHHSTLGSTVMNHKKKK